MIVLRKGHVEGLRLARLESRHRILEVGQHGAFAKNEGIILGLTALERYAVFLTQEVDRHAIARCRRTVDRLVTDALFAQYVQRVFQLLLADFKRRTLNVYRLKIGDDDLGINLESCREFQILSAFRLFRFDLRAACDAHLLRLDRLGEGFLQRCVQRIDVSVLSVLLLDHAERHLTRTKTRHFEVLAHPFQALVDVLVEVGNGYRQIEATFKSAGLRRGLVSGRRGVGFH